MKEQMDALARQYEAELIEQFKAGEITADELRAALEDIPVRVYWEVQIKASS